MHLNIFESIGVTDVRFNELLKDMEDRCVDKSIDSPTLMRVVLADEQYTQAEKYAIMYMIGQAEFILQFKRMM